MSASLLRGKSGAKSGKLRVEYPAAPGFITRREISGELRGYVESKLRSTA
jgi:hypothetical protein